VERWLRAGRLTPNSSDTGLPINGNVKKPKEPIAEQYLDSRI
jgi:hypothetical protein